MKISCVICAYNEAPRIGAVLSVVAEHPLLHEIIVVDDGSTDTTAEIVRQFPMVKLISYPVNRGKSHALAHGVAAAQGALIIYLDADLKNLSAAHIHMLAEPVMSGTADMSISLRDNSLPLYRALGIDFVSGERVVSRDFVMRVIKEIDRLPPFGVEVYLNEHIIREKLRIAIVPLTGIINTRKSEKMGWIRGTLSDWKTTLDVLRVISPLGVLRQNYHMLQLSRAATK